MRGTGLLDGYGAPLTATHYDGTCARAEVQRALPALGGLSGSRRRTLPCGEFDRRRRNCPTSCRSRSSEVEVASSARRRLAACGARSLFIAALKPASLRSCPLPSQCNMRRASPLEKSSAMPRNRRSWVGWPSSKGSSPSVGLRASHPRSAGSSDRASPSRSGAFTSLETSVAARPC
jgi:hypothetical protein